LEGLLIKVIILNGFLTASFLKMFLQC